MNKICNICGKYINIKTLKKHQESKRCKSFLNTNLKEELKKINKFINNNYCPVIDNKVHDDNNLYKLNSTNELKIKIKNKITKIIGNNEKIDNLVNEILPLTISSGTKGVIRGNLFNKEVSLIIKETINDRIHLKYFEEKIPKNKKLSERPDWFIDDTKNNKLLIGYNQLDLWNGGQQYNRGDKYMNITNEDKIIFVICKKTKLFNKNKKFRIFKLGIEKEILFYPKNLKNYIINFFK